jgi:plastocyanin
MYKKLIFGITVFSLLTILLAACSIKEGATSSGIEAKMGASNFIDTKVTLQKGQSVTLVDEVASLHTITNGRWVGSQAKAEVEPGAPQVHFSISNAGASQNVGPFTTSGTFYLYCTIHPGMNLEIDVK